MARFFTGTSGWSYRHWRGAFYPPGLPPRDWLAHYATWLPSVEINASFYHLPHEPVLARWRTVTPAGFVFAVKAWRALTHRRRLVDCAEPLEVFLSRIAALKDKRGPVLFQLPPRFPADPDRLEAFADLLPAEGRFAFEFRDPSWHCDAVYEVLAARNLAFCPFEFGDHWSPRVVTADFVYVRLHGRAAPYRGDYDDDALADWADWLWRRHLEGRDVHTYFDNTDEGDAALRDARRLDDMLAARDRAGGHS